MIDAKWPKEYRIKSRRWEIEYVDRLKDADSEDPEDTDNDLLGCCRADLRKISISLDQSEESMRDTLYHELVHACYSTAPMAGSTEDDEDTEENIVLFATEAFFEIVLNSESEWWR